MWLKKREPHNHIAHKKSYCELYDYVLIINNYFKNEKPFLLFTRTFDYLLL